MSFRQAVQNQRLLFKSRSLPAWRERLIHSCRKGKRHNCRLSTSRRSPFSVDVLLVAPSPVEERSVWPLLQPTCIRRDNVFHPCRVGAKSHFRESSHTGPDSGSLLKRGEMKTALIAGIVLIVLGVIGLAYGGIHYKTQQRVFDAGPIHATREKHETIPIPPVLGGNRPCRWHRSRGRRRKAKIAPSGQH